MSEIVAEKLCLDFEVVPERGRTLKETVVNFARTRSLRNERKIVRALDDVSFRISHGERVAFLGHNGAGKSTLLRTIAGIYRPNSGTLQVTGKVLPLLQASGSFNMELTGRENVLQAQALMRIPRKTAIERADSILEFADLTDYGDIPTKYYSLGMTARLAFAALTSETPEILLLDESLGAGDLSFRSKAQARLDELMQNASTILLVSHDLQLVQRVSTRVIWLDNGRVIAEGNPADIIENYMQRSPVRRQSAA